MSKAYDDAKDKLLKKIREIKNEEKKFKPSKCQQKFLDAVILGKSVSLEGKAGTGKSAVVKEAMNILRKNKKKVIALAPTGVAANNIGGQTVHSMFSINPSGVASFDTCNFLKGEKRRMLNEVDVIFIDEAYMLRCDVLDAINWTLLKNGVKSLDKFQLVFIGDRKQIEPIASDNTRSVLFRTYDSVFIDSSKIWPKLKIARIELEEVLRQSDPDFINALNIVRDGGKSEYFRRFVNTEPSGVVLAPYVTTVQKYNEEGLNKINQPEIIFDAKITGNIKADDFNMETKIRVKNGAKIMYLINSKDHNDLVNGTIGTFISHAGCHYIKVGDIEYSLNKVELEKKEYVLNETKNELELRVLGSIEQYPFKLAYAISIHKAQGITLSHVTVDLTRPVFAPGMLYVALSRCTSPENLRIIV